MIATAHYEQGNHQFLSKMNLSSANCETLTVRRHGLPVLRVHPWLVSIY